MPIAQLVVQTDSRRPCSATRVGFSSHVQGISDTTRRPRGRPRPQAREDAPAAAVGSRPGVGSPTVRGRGASIVGALAIRAAGFSSSTTKSLAYRAVEMSRGVTAQQDLRHSSIDSFASLLDVLAHATGSQPSAAEAERLVRDGDDHELANRVRAAARTRNSSAHHDRALLRDFTRFAASLHVDAEDHVAPFGSRGCTKERRLRPMRWFKSLLSRQLPWCGIQIPSGTIASLGDGLRRRHMLQGPKGRSWRAGPVLQQ